MQERLFSDVMHKVVRRGLRPGSLSAYGFAVLCILVAAALGTLIRLVAPNTLPFAIFFPALLIATLVGGLGSGIVATLLGAFMSWYLFITPQLMWPLDLRDRISSVALYFFASALIVWTAQQYRVVLRRIDEEEQYRQVVVDELGHRVKNKLATIYAILRHELRGQPAIWDSVSGRLRALSAADDFIVQADGKGVDLRQILEMELEPYGDGRIALSGEPVRVFEKLPTVLALVFHELATNSAKYGSLSAAAGRVDVSWSDAGDHTAIAWIESGGPPVEAPSRRSFGSKLIEHSLDAFGGTATLQFAATGVICRIRLPKAEARPDRAANSAAAE